MPDNVQLTLPDELRKLVPEPPPPIPKNILESYVKSFITKKKAFIEIWEQNGRQPLYVVDKPALLQNSRNIRTAFRKLIPNTSFYYAVKSNNCPEIAKVLIDDNFGLDVSSGVELRNSLELGSGDLVFSGPGKTEAELLLAIENSEKVVVLMDSFGELDKLARLSAAANTRVRAGVRITPPLPDSWRKFGIPLERLREFWVQASKNRHVKLRGIQFHTSWNLNPDRQIQTIEALGNELAKWPAKMRSQIEFIDIGGGIWPPSGEWIQAAATPLGKLKRLAGNSRTEWSLRHKADSLPVEEFAQKLHQAIEKHISPLVACRICLEPGRWICSTAMHILISVSDKKEPDLVITDAATNTVGWELFEQHYCPVINLSQPLASEKKCDILGSLCTPEDIWGYSFWGAGIKDGDLLVLPHSGAYSYSLRQEFIKPLPKVAVMH